MQCHDRFCPARRIRSALTRTAQHPPRTQGLAKDLVHRFTHGFRARWLKRHKRAGRFGMPVSVPLCAAKIKVGPRKQAATAAI